MIRRGLSKSAGMMAASRLFSFGGRAKHGAGSNSTGSATYNYLQLEPLTAPR